MKIRAVSIGEAVPRERFDAVIQSVFDSALNLRLADEEHLIALVISDHYELPQGIRIVTKGLSLRTLTPGLRVATRSGILRFDSSSLSVDLRGASVWKCRVPELGLNMQSHTAQQAWSTTWTLLNQEQRHKNTELLADDLFRPHTGSPLSQRISKPVTSLVTSTDEFNPRGALHAAGQMIGLGPGVTPSGDDILIGFLAGLWSMAGENGHQLAFIRSFGRELIQLAKGTSEISRTYLYHAAQGQFSSSLSHLAEAITTSDCVEEAARAAMRVGHSSGMDAVTGLLIGLCVWNIPSPLYPSPAGRGDGGEGKDYL
ncbi:MAG: DUF2877 domain-containing protein [Chloroflexota bacterium]